MLKVHKKSAHNTYNHNVIQKLNTQNAKYKSFFFFLLLPKLKNGFIQKYSQKHLKKS